jgi:hypothetical protein
VSPEATAAIVGALVGGGIGFFAQLGVLSFTGKRERRAAAQLIYAELTVNNCGSNDCDQDGPLAEHDRPAEARSLGRIRHEALDFTWYPARCPHCVRI